MSSSAISRIARTGLEIDLAIDGGKKAFPPGTKALWWGLG